MFLTGPPDLEKFHHKNALKIENWGTAPPFCPGPPVHVWMYLLLWMCLPGREFIHHYLDFRLSIEVKYWRLDVLLLRVFFWNVTQALNQKTILMKQKVFSIIEFVLLISRLASLFAGFYFFDSDMYSIALYGLIGFLYNIFLIIYLSKMVLKNKYIKI